MHKHLVSAHEYEIPFPKWVLNQSLNKYVDWHNVHCPLAVSVNGYSSTTRTQSMQCMPALPMAYGHVLGLFASAWTCEALVPGSDGGRRRRYCRTIRPSLNRPLAYRLRGTVHARDKPPTGSTVVHAAGASSRPVLALFSVHRWESDGWWFVGWRPARRTASLAARGGVHRSCAGGWGGSEPTATPPPRAGATRSTKPRGVGYSRLLAGSRAACVCWWRRVNFVRWVIGKRRALLEKRVEAGAVRVSPARRAHRRPCTAAARPPTSCLRSASSNLRAS
jgi:hypothetical protein